MQQNSLYRTPEGARVVMERYARIIDGWPVPYEGLTVATRHGDTFVIASGPPDAPPLVLLHGTCSNATSWFGDVAAYSAQLRVYAVDEPGEPGRSAANRPPWTGPAYAEWLEDVLAGLGAPQAYLLGLSQGGWLALKFATSCPERVSKLVLLAPGGVAPARLSFLLRAIPLSLLGRPGAEAINRITLGRQPVAPEAIVIINEIMTHFRPRIEPQPLFTDAELRRLTMPVLLVAGARDALLPSARTAARLQALLPQLTLDLKPEAGHALINLAPEILPWLLAPQPAGSRS